ncbi:Fic family protein [Chryseobacterium salipaludis]|uniref:Fic family protein n=1 Tax=Chryseobacterium TaxID=59732 RepID=UPI001FF5D88B|nr:MULTISPECIES: Fic family protein [Chryseobacterium]MCJ8498763.1 Fic family protein [Chryseobacterium salipaludis]MCX3297331.1 Fic family protein [Planobacterium sp. JC490]
MINLEKYIAGKKLKHSTGYTFFLPSEINDAWIWEDQSVNKLLEKAAIKLGELNSFSKLVPNIDLFIQLHVTKEAVVSSRIEGTQTQMDEALLDEEEISPERKNDWVEVNNYIRALNEAIKELETLPISSRLIKKTHQILLDSVRGEHKQPGEFRNSQNWIGGNSLADAVFIPPNQVYVNELMGDLEKFLHNEDINVPALIKIGIAHYQFETIHPFLDGNGRIGRLLITLYLVDQKILNKPLLYLSAFFEKNKGLYYDNLTFVRSKNDMKQWLKYFLVGVAETAEKATQTLSEVLELKARLETLIHTTFGKRANNASVLLQYLFRKPVIHVNQVAEVTRSTYKTANDLVTEFVKAGILKEMTGQSRNRVFVFDEYIKLF